MSDHPLDPLDDISEQLLAAVQRVGPAARQEAFAANLPVTYYENGHLWQLWPDGKLIDLGAPNKRAG